MTLKRYSKREREFRERLEALAPEATLAWQPIPGIGLTGLLLEREAASRPLSDESTQRVMENPPFWSLLWPAGYLLCRLFIASSDLVSGRCVVDLGCGSGLVSVALARAGAHVVASDLDDFSLRLTTLHAHEHQVQIETESNWQGHADLLILGDFLYDEDNLECLDELAKRSKEIVIADSRLQTLERDGYTALGSWKGVAVPDLDPHKEFGTVRFWYRGPHLEQWLRATKKVLN